MNRKLLLVLALAVFVSAAYADSKEKTKENSKEDSSESSKQDSKEDSGEDSSKETTTATTTAGPDRCVGEADGAVLASLTDCGSFVTCAAEVASPDTGCVPAGTIFDATRKVCDYPENVSCDIALETTVVVEPETEATTVAAEPTEAELKQKCKGSVISMLPHPGNCRKFILCVLGHATITNCGSNQSFFAEHKLCEFGDAPSCK